MRDLDTISTQVSVFFENVDDNEKKDNEEKENEKNKLVKCVPKEGQEEITCHVCHEVFETFWDDENDDWMLRDAIKAKESFYHDSCYQEVSLSPSEEQFPVLSGKKRKAST